MTKLFTAAHWRKARADYMQAARDCRDTLTDPQGFWKHQPTDERVKTAVGFWVARARRAHAIALGKEPVIEKAVSIRGGEMVCGELYAGAL